MATAFTKWRATFGNGAAIGIAPTTTRRWQIKVVWQTIRKDLIHHLTRVSLTRKSAYIAEVPSFVTSNIAHVISSARVVKVRSTPAPITWAFVA